MVVVEVVCPGRCCSWPLLSESPARLVGFGNGPLELGSGADHCGGAEPERD